MIEKGRANYPSTVLQPFVPFMGPTHKRQDRRGIRRRRDTHPSPR